MLDFYLNMVFNTRMNQIAEDAKLIREMGGPTKVAAILAAGPKVSVQRVQNWLTRGIPSHIKVAYPHYFMRGAAQADAATQPTEQ